MIVCPLCGAPTSGGHACSTVPPARFQGLDAWEPVTHIFFATLGGSRDVEPSPPQLEAPRVMPIAREDRRILRDVDAYIGRGLEPLARNTTATRPMLTIDLRDERKR